MKTVRCDICFAEIGTELKARVQFRLMPKHDERPEQTGTVAEHHVRRFAEDGEMDGVWGEGTRAEVSDVCAKCLSDMLQVIAAARRAAMDTVVEESRSRGVAQDAICTSAAKALGRVKIRARQAAPLENPTTPAVSSDVANILATCRQQDGTPRATDNDGEEIPF